jgi:hypothetical protein
MKRMCSLSRSNSSAHHHLIRTALLLEFGGMCIGATDFIRLLMRKLTFDRIRLSLAAAAAADRAAAAHGPVLGSGGGSPAVAVAICSDVAGKGAAGA